MSRRGLVLFVLLGVIWGMPYLFIKEAVASFSPAAVVAGRTLIAAVVLLPLAIRQQALRPALRHWRWVLAFGIVEMAGPFMLLARAEQTLPSGLTGLLVSTVPLFAAVIAFTRGERSALAVGRVAGLVVGMVGIALVVGGDRAGTVDAMGVIQVLLTAVLYAVAPFIVASRLQDVPALGSITVSLTAVGLGYLPIALLTQDGSPTGRSVAALTALAVLCTAIAFVVFFALIAEVGPTRAPLITYVNPIVALGLGVLVLDETLTALMLVGVVLTLVGCWFAAQHRPSRADPAITEPVELAPAAGS